ncbi:MAG: peptidoglycan DD-metalloendopeptidase family protein [bacterium]
MKKAFVQRFVTYSFLTVSAFLVWRGDVARLALRESGDDNAAEAAAIARADRATYGPLHEISGEITRGDRLGGALTSAGLEPPLVDLILTSLVDVFDPRGIRPGDTFRAIVDPEMALLGFEYDRVGGETIRVEPQGEEYTAVRVVEPVERRVVMREGDITSSLFESIKRAGGSAEEVELFANIFNGSFDFFSESHKGDAFSYVLEADYSAEGMRRPVRVLSAEYISKGRAKTLAAFHYTPTGAEKGGYYSADGSPLARRFIKCPLPFSRVTSRFTHSRRHPILKTCRPHLGVDFAAPTGTPVSVVADGVVITASRQGGLGNTVKVRHTGGIETTYGHLSRYGSGVRSGVRVSQGQVIGYVGSTGLSTGPHLDYRISKGGVFVDPLKFESPGGPSLPAAELANFYIARDGLVALTASLQPGEPQPAFVAIGSDSAVAKLSQRS